MIPSFIETLAHCKEAYIMAQEEYGSNRFNKREFQGALPKRKGKTKMLFRLKKRTLARRWWSAAEERMLAAAYDQGLLEKHKQVDNEVSKQTS